MLHPLIEWLTSRRWVRSDTVIVEELPVNGRRVDLSVLTRSGSLSAFELKIGGFGRALEQAYYNRRLYDRSWVVVSAVPRNSNLYEAELAGVGVIVFRQQTFEVLVQPGRPVHQLLSRQRLATKIRERSVNHV